MSLITFVSHRGSPGVTSTALAVGGAWPASSNRRKLIVEVDPAGGVLALRLGLAEDPGLVSLAAAARHGLAREDLWEHAQVVPGGLAVVPSPSSIAVASQLLATSSAAIGPWLAELGDVDVIADAGRLAPQSPASPLIDASDLVVMVARPVVDQLHSAAAQLVALRDRGVRAGWCLSGDGAYDSTAVESAYGIPVLGTLPSDARGASLLFSAAATRRLTRTPLVRAASSLANHLATWLTDREGEDVAHVASGRPADEAVVDSGSAGARA